MNNPKLAELNFKLDDLEKELKTLTTLEQRRGKTSHGFNFDNKIWPPNRREIRMQHCYDGFFSSFYPINPQLWGAMRAVSNGTWRDEDGWIYIASRQKETVCFYRLHPNQVAPLANAMKFDTDFEKLILQAVASYSNHSNCLCADEVKERQKRLKMMRSILDAAIERNEIALTGAKINEE